MHSRLYNQAYFMGLIFAVRQSSVKTAKIGPLKTSHNMVSVHVAVYSIEVHVKSILLAKYKIDTLGYIHVLSYQLVPGIE